MKSNFVRINNRLNLHYLEEKNRSDYTLLLIHGLSSSAYLWEPITKKFNNHDLNIYALDLRGHGLSDKPDGEYSLSQLSQDVKSFLIQKKLENIIVVGQSMGADLAVMLASEKNSKIVGCVCIDGGAIDLKQKYQDWNNCFDKLKPPMLDGEDKDSLMKRWKRYKTDWPQEALDSQMNIFEIDSENKIKKRLSLENHMKIVRSIWENKPYFYLNSLEVPILFILVNFSLNYKKIVNNNLNIKQVKLEGDHDIHAQKPDIVSDIIVSAIQENFFEES